MAGVIIATPPAGKRASKAVVVGFFEVDAPFLVPVLVADGCPDFVFVFLAVVALESPVSEGDTESSVFEGA